MKTCLKILLPVLVLVAVSGCMLPKASRLIPENKSARIRIVNPLYGYIEIDTRVVGDTNALGPLPDPAPIIGPAQPIQPTGMFVPSYYQITPVNR